MHLVEILLPVRDNEGVTFANTEFARVRDKLANRFGGVTSFARSPAEGIWKTGTNEVKRDEIVVLEVMVDPLERGWWMEFRRDLELRFHQQVIVITSGNDRAALTETQSWLAQSADKLTRPRFAMPPYGVATRLRG